MTDSERSKLFRRKLQEGFLIGDGAMGTALSEGGQTPGRSLELLNVEDPDAVAAVHRSFVEAGSDAIQTNTFQGSRAALERHGLGDRAAELNRAGAALAREIAGDRIFVGGSMGPSSRLLEPYGDFPESDARQAFAEQARALAEGGVDFLIVETMIAIEESAIAVRGAAETGLPVVASMAFDPNGRTAFGVTPEQAAEQLVDAGASVVGANCGTVRPSEMVDIVAQFCDAASVPVIAQPNAGPPERGNTGVIHPETPEAVADAAGRFREVGARYIGGCCGTTAEHLRAIVARLRGA